MAGLAVNNPPRDGLTGRVGFAFRLGLEEEVAVLEAEELEGYYYSLAT